MLGKKLAIKPKKPSKKWFRISWYNSSDTIMKAASKGEIIKKLSLYKFCRWRPNATKEELMDKNLNIFYYIEEIKNVEEKIKQKHCYLTVKELKEVLKALPDNMPVFYQRIEDYYFKKMDWSITPILWESREYDEFIPAFGAYVSEGKLAIHAHY